MKLIKITLTLLAAFLILAVNNINVKAEEVKAYAPYPADGGYYLNFAPDSRQSEYLPFTWHSSDTAASYDVYFGASPAAISKANKSSGEFAGTIKESKIAYNESFFNGAFDTNKTYYWRVDLNTESETIKGSIWKFNPGNWDKTEYERRGAEVMIHLKENFGRPDGGFWEDTEQTQAAFAWPLSVMLLAYNRAEEADGGYSDGIDSLVAFLNRYRSDANGIIGYDCVIDPYWTNRFYDDNSWLSWSLAEAYSLTGIEKYLTRAKEAFEFVLTGEDEAYGGGVWWKETQYDGDQIPSKAVSATGGGALAGALLYKITDDEKYLADSERLLDFLQNVMREGDGQILNDYSGEGIGRWYWSYNTAVPAMAYAVLYEASSNKIYLDSAVELGEVLIDYYFDKTVGALKDEAYFAFTIIECFSRLYNATGDNRYLSIISKSLDNVYAASDSGFYSKMWDAQLPSVNEKSLLINASAARAFYTASLLSPDTQKSSDSDSDSNNKIYIIVIAAFTGILIVAFVLMFAKKILTENIK